jgi:hypothetical protein
MVDLSGRDLAERKYLSFGQGEDEHIPILTASTYKLAQSFIRLLRLKNSN